MTKSSIITSIRIISMQYHMSPFTKITFTIGLSIYHSIYHIYSFSYLPNYYFYLSLYHIFIYLSYLPIYIFLSICYVGIVEPLPLLTTKINDATGVGMREKMQLKSNTLLVLLPQWLSMKLSHSVLISLIILSLLPPTESR